MIEDVAQLPVVSGEANTNLFAEPATPLPVSNNSSILSSSLVVDTTSQSLNPLTTASVVPLSANVQSALTSSSQVSTTSSSFDLLLGAPLVVNDSDQTSSFEINKVQYTGRWNVTSDVNSYQSDNHWTDDIGATYQVKFKGEQIRLFGAKTPWHGLAGISIDGGAEILVDTFSTSVLNSTLLFQSSVLNDGVHTLTVRLTGQKNLQSSGYNLLLDKLEVYGASVQPRVLPTSTSTVIIDDQDQGTIVNKVKFTGTWNLGEGGDAYGGSNHWTNNAGATYETQFYGSQVKLFGSKAPWHGIAAISIDGGVETLVDTFGGSFHKTLLYANTSLNEGLHSIKVRVTGQRSANATDSYLLIDQLEATSTVPSIVSPTPKITSSIIVDDHTIGAGLNQVQYTGNWNPGQASESYNGNNFWTKEKDATYTAKFSGSEIKLFGAKAPWHGVAAISIDGGAETFIDTFGFGLYNNSLLYAQNGLTQGEHTIRVRVTGERNENATDNYLLIDRLEVTNTDRNIVTPNSSFLTFSPYNWVPVGDAVQTSNAGSYIKFRFDGSQAILNVDTNSQTSFPLLDVFVDGQQVGNKLWLKDSSNGQIQLFNGTAGEHEAVVYFRQREFFDRSDANVLSIKRNDWSTDAEHLQVTGVTINGGNGFLADTSTRVKQAVFFGDSITEGGLQSYEPGPDRTPNFPDVNIPQSPSYKTYAARLGDLLDVNYGQVGWSGSGWLRPAPDTGEPAILGTWLKYNGKSSITRDFNPSPDYVFVNLGTNDADFNVTSTVYTWLQAARQKIPGADIFVILPFNQTKNAEIQAAIAQYQLEFPTDQKVYTLNLGAEGARGLEANGAYLPELSVDKVHPTASRHRELAGLLFDQINPILGSPKAVINDSDLDSGTGLNTVVYSGQWVRQERASAFGQDLHVSNTTNSQYQVTIRGTKFQLYGGKSSASGMIGISIDGSPEILVDTYNSSLLNNAILYQSDNLTQDYHTITVRVTGQKNAAASDSFLLFDRLEVIN